MTREEEIREAGIKYATHLTDTDRTDFYGNYEKEMQYNANEHRAFIEGAKWADNNIYLSSLWNDINILPSENKGIIYLTKKGKIGVIKAIKSNKWDWYVADKYSIIKWAYVDDLLPKGGEK